MSTFTTLAGLANTIYTLNLDRILKATALKATTNPLYREHYAKALENISSKLKHKVYLGKFQDDPSEAILDVYNNQRKLPVSAKQWLKEFPANEPMASTSSPYTNYMTQKMDDFDYFDVGTSNLYNRFKNNEGYGMIAMPKGNAPLPAALHELGHNLVAQKNPKLQYRLYMNDTDSFSPSLIQPGSSAVDPLLTLAPNLALGGLTRVAVNARPYLPELQNEWLASWEGYKALRETGAPGSVKWDYVKSNLPAFGTYLRRVLPGS